MSFRTAYANAIVTMSEGDIYYIPSLRKALVRVIVDGVEEALPLNKSILDNAIERDHVKETVRDGLAYSYELTEKGKAEAIKIIESRAWATEVTR